MLGYVIAVWLLLPGMVWGVTAAWVYDCSMVTVGWKGFGVNAAWLGDCTMVTVGWEGFGGSLLPRYMITASLVLAGKVLGVTAAWVCDCTMVTVS